MFEALSKRLHRDERGFTLIELMVVVLIIAILIAIAIPTFLGARTKAQDRAAQVGLRQALLTEKTFYTDNETYDATSAQLIALEPTIGFDDVVANASKTKVGYTGSDTDVVMVQQSKSNKWFCIADSVSAGTTYNSGANQSDVDTVAECNGTSW
jgi:type IV pilus assembly protein PilA